MIDGFSHDDPEGLLYSSRRKFLASAGKSCLEPPNEFKTRRQARRKHLQNIFENEPSPMDSAYLYLQKPSIPRKRESQFVLQSLLPTPKKFDLPSTRVRRTGKHALGFVFLDSGDHDSSTESWKEESTAGVKCWINKCTGEVTTDCPWIIKKRNLLQISDSRKRLISSPMTTIEDNVLPGTGALVYDRTEVDELFKLLEFSETKKRAPNNYDFLYHSNLKY
jgi:hypothetical protein